MAQPLPCPEPGASDPDVDLRVPAQRRELARGRASVLAAVALGGGAGAAARYGVSLLQAAPPPGAFPWPTLAVNVTGCAVMGVFMVLLTERWRAHRLLRPFFGTGVLGGYTTFSTWTDDIRRLAVDGHPLTAAADLLLTVVSALGAVWAAAAVTRRLLVGRPREGRA